MRYLVFRLRDRPESEGPPQAEPIAELSLDAERAPTWVKVDEEFQALGMPCFEKPLRYGPGGGLEPLEPYSDEALGYLSEFALPARGFFLTGPH